MRFLDTPKALFVFAAICYVFGAWLTLSSLKMLNSAVEVPASVIDHDINRHHDYDDGSDSDTPVVTFRFSFDETSYTADGLRPGITESFSPRWGAQLVLNDFPIGSKVTAYVPKHDPNSAFLIPVPSFFPVVLVLFAIGLACGAIYMRLLSNPFRAYKNKARLYVLWPVFIFAACSLIAAPWTFVVTEDKTATVAIWAFTALLTITTLVLVLVVKNRDNPFAKDATSAD